MRGIANSALIGIFALILSGVAAGAVYYVPDDFSTIQQAIDGSSSGDTIVVRPGLYIENIDFGGLAITIESERGPQETVIDGRTPAQADWGAVVTFRSGENTDSVLNGFTVTNGSGNVYEEFPGAPRSRLGGGVCCHQSSPTLINNVIVGNRADRGAGIWCRDGSPKIVNNIITANTATNGGGGVSCRYASPTITNNTVIENVAQFGGGFGCGDGSNPVVTNTIFWNNTAQLGKEIWIGWCWNPASFTISHSNIDGGQSSVHVNSGCMLYWNMGMIDADPIFIEPATNDFHIGYNSPCRNKGLNSAPALPSIDFEGNRRISENLTDIGADEADFSLYRIGTPQPGSTIELRVFGKPGMLVTIGRGSGLRKNPYHTMYGDYYLRGYIREYHPGRISSSGVLCVPSTLPLNLIPGEEIPFQALVGAKIYKSSGLTNPIIVTVAP